METDARGQLGGYDTTEAVRRRLASESPWYKCPICGRTNSEIIKESEGLAKEASAAVEDVKVPDELKMGFRDEMEASKKENSTEEDKETAELAEGFVQTISNPPLGDSAGETSTDPVGRVGLQNQARPAQSVPQPARTVRSSGQRAQRQVNPGEARRVANEGVPVWIDRMIVALVVLLAGLLLKVLFGA